MTPDPRSGLDADGGFTPVFTGPGYGLVKPGSSVSRAAFDGAAAALSPGGDTPLADALADVHDTLSEPPFGTIKRAMGHSYFLMKGLNKVAAEMSLTVLSYNIKRVINLIGVKKMIAAVT